MFCDRCGATLQPDQRFCGKCGREFSGAIQLAYARPGRVREHLRLLGILWLAYSAVSAVGGFVLFILANTLFVHLPEISGQPAATAWLHPFLAGIAIFVLVKSAAGFIAGWGLVQRESWARIVSLVLAFFSLFNIPFGTALGIYTLWVLLPAQSEAEYEQEIRGAGAA